MFALAATLQQKGALGMGEVSLRSPASFLRLVRQTWWLLRARSPARPGTLPGGRTRHGKLAVIQPLLVTTIVFALPLGYLLTGQVVNRPEIVAAAFVVVGLAVFAVVGDAAAGNDSAPGWEWAIAIAVLGPARRAPRRRRGGSMARRRGIYGACAGLLYGLSASLWKPSGALLEADGLGGMLASWEFWVFAVAGILAFLVQQVSLATGSLAPSVAMTPSSIRSSASPSAPLCSKRGSRRRPCTGRRLRRPGARAGRRGGDHAGNRRGRGAVRGGHGARGAVTRTGVHPDRHLRF